MKFTELENNKDEVLLSHARQGSVFAVLPDSLKLHCPHAGEAS